MIFVPTKKSSPSEYINSAGSLPKIFSSFEYKLFFLLTLATTSLGSLILYIFKILYCVLLVRLLLDGKLREVESPTIMLSFFLDIFWGYVDLVFNTNLVAGLSYFLSEKYFIN